LYWYGRNWWYFHLGLDKRDDVALFRYRRLAADPETSFASVCAFIGLSFSRDMVVRVHSRSVARGRELALDPGIVDLCQNMLDRLDVAAGADRGDV